MLRTSAETDAWPITLPLPAMLPVDSYCVSGLVSLLVAVRLNDSREHNPYRPRQQGAALRGPDQLRQIAPHRFPDSGLIEPVEAGQRPLDVLDLAWPATSAG